MTRVRKDDQRSASELASVRRSVWDYIARTGLAYLLLGFFFFPEVTSYSLYVALMLPWLLLVAAILAYRADLLYTEDGTLLEKLNLATQVTLIRVLSVPLIFLLIYQGRLKAAGILFLLAALTDWLDGFLARRMGEVTQLGRMVDPSIDAVFCSATFLALGMGGRIPLLLLFLAGIRYGLLLAGAIAVRATLGELPVRATFSGRMFYFLQYSLLFIYLLSDGQLSPDRIHQALSLLQILVSFQLLLLGWNMLTLHLHGDRPTDSL
jgi:phosphatidylglycerophosphate synthase